MTPDPLHEINILANNMLATMRCQDDPSILVAHEYDQGILDQQLVRARRIAELSDSGKGEG